MSDSDANSEWTYDITTQKGIINLILLLSAIAQTVIFVYHWRKHDRTSKLPNMHEYLEMFAVVFFIVAVVLSEFEFSWNHWMKFDTTLASYTESIDATYNYIVQWLGIGLLLLGNGLFVWIEMYLDKGVQSPLFLNDISIRNIGIDISMCEDEAVMLVISEDMSDMDKQNKMYWNEKELITAGPYSWCRHPIYLIWASWEFGYLLITGHWFEYLSFTTFIFVEALRVDIIDKSLLYKYRQSYVDYVVRTLNAFFPSFVGKYVCSLDLAVWTCCWKEWRRVGDYEFIGALNKDSKRVRLIINNQD